VISRECRRRDDGATMILALVIVTSVALVVAALIGQSSTSIKATINLRDQAGSAYNGDGAAQTAINALRKGTFDNADGSDCFAGGPVLNLPDFYPKTNGANGTNRSSASVVCTAEAGTGAQGSPVVITDANRPGQAVYTVRSLAFGQSASETDYIHGSVAAGTTLNVKGNLAVTGTGVKLTAGTCQFGANITPTCTSPAKGVDPGLSPPTRNTSVNPTPTCPTKNNGPEIFTEGTYTKTPPAVRNCGKTVGWYYFTPGTYYFNYTGQWTIGTTVVAGTLDLGGDGTGAGGTTIAPAGDAPAPTVPNACVNPLRSTTANGVAFVFGGTSGINFDHDSHAEFCASYGKTSISTVAYGLTAASGSVPALGACSTNLSCAVLRADNGSAAEFYFEGFVYAPTGYISVDANNVTQPFFDFGIVARDLFLGANPSNKCDQCAFINLPDNSPGYGTAATIVDLTVYVCPGVSSSVCSTDASRKVALTARVQVDDAVNGKPGQRPITILSWSVQR
jgi:hypothetical protein